MCGFSGVVGDDSLKRIKRSIPFIKNRGPDEINVASIAEFESSIVHARLSIQDTSPAGRQPMSTFCGQYTLLFNGEIYNKREIKNCLRKDGENLAFQGKSDTEVLLHYLRQNIDHLEGALPKIDGMFAFCLIDHKEKKVHLSRDRNGEKPLYYYWDDNNFAFSSNLFSLHSIVDAKLELNEEALTYFLAHGYFPNTLTLYKPYKKLSATQILTYDVTQKKANFSKFDVLTKREIDKEITRKNAIETFEQYLSESVEQRLISDVPICCYLSSGIDSALIATEMNKHFDRFDTFTLAIDDVRFDETAEATAIAAQLNTHHNVITTGKSEVVDALEAICAALDEPIADSSVIPSMLLAKSTSQQYKVVLGGDGADEFYYGYPRYKSQGFVNRNYNGLRLLNGLQKKVAPVISVLFKDEYMLRRIHKLSNLTMARSRTDFYGRLSSLPTQTPISLLDNYDYSFSSEIDPMVTDQNFYLPDNLMVKSDRTSMHYGLEVRAPFLSNNLTEFGRKISDRLHSYDGNFKYIPRSVLKNRLALNSVAKVKKGFYSPIDLYVSNYFFEQIHNCFEQSCIFNQYLTKDYLLKILNDHLNGTKLNGPLIWSIFLLKNNIYTLERISRCAN